MKILVAIPTTNRAATVRETVDRLRRQHRPPDMVMVVGVTPQDVEGLDALSPALRIEFAPRGLCSQRNRALALAADTWDLIVFFDDDFIAEDAYLLNAERLFAQDPDIVGATGRLIADGVHGQGIDFPTGARLVDAARPREPADLQITDSLYGCNMVLRLAATRGQWFNENLPLYGWQEDIDFTFRLGERGRLVSSSELTGVHLGQKAGRSPGKRLGYSQIANPLYLLGKRSMPRKLAARLMAKNLSANVWRSVWPQAHVDHRGRLNGNLLAFMDLIGGRLHPRRILQIK